MRALKARPSRSRRTSRAVRDRLYLNIGPDWRGRSRFREVAQQAGIEASVVDHGLGSAFTDVNGDGRIDLYVANDLDPNRLYLNVPTSNGLGFRFEERGAEAGVADRNAGMGVAAADYSGDGRPDLFVTNSHRQLHGVFESRGRGSVRGRPAGLRSGLRHDARGLGRVVGRPRPGRLTRPRARQRRHPHHEPEDGRRADQGARRARATATRT